MKYINHKHNPKGVECIRLFQSCFILQERKTRQRVLSATKQQNRMHHAACALEQLWGDHEHYGSLPGGCIDCMAFVNRLCFLLFTIDSSICSERLRTFGVAFISSETENYSTKMLKTVMSVVPVSHAMDFIDPDTSVVASAKKILKNSF